MEISSRYAWLHAQQPVCFKWAAMAAIASHHARLVLYPFRLDADSSGYVDLARSLSRWRLLTDGFRQVLRPRLWSRNLAPSGGAFEDLRRAAGHAGLVADDGFMIVELLVVPECPNEGEAAVRLREALDDVGLVATPFRTTVINTFAEAEARGFVGSPTILIDGRDPFAAPEPRPALACRVYPGVTGVVGVPPLRELRQALKRAADSGGPGLS